MKVHPHRAWPGAAFIIKGSALQFIWGWLIVLFLWAAAFTWYGLTHEIQQWGFTFSTIPLSLIGVALSIFLGFRNNACYDRFWEGRKLWGSLVNTSRSFTRQVLTLVHPTDPRNEAEVAEVNAFQKEIVHRAVAYVHSLRMRLRDDDRFAQALEGMLPATDLRRLPDESNPPIAILQGMGDRLAHAYQKGWIDRMHLPVLERSLTDMTDIQGGCERIKSTPLPKSYTVLTHRVVGVFCFILPFGVFQEVGPLTPIVTLVVSYAYLGLDAIGAQIEEPFGFDANDLPLSQLSRMIEINIRERLGETDLPPAVDAIDNVLS